MESQEPGHEAMQKQFEADHSKSELNGLLCLNLNEEEAYWLRTYLSVYDNGLYNGMIRSTDNKRDHRMIRTILDKLAASYLLPSD